MQADVAIIVGGGRDSSEILNQRSLQRLDLAASLFKSFSFPLIIASGGISFAAGPEIQTTEASLLSKGLVERGIPQTSILLEEFSTDTLTNLYFSRTEHIERLACRSITIISSDFHVPRCRWLAGKVFGMEYVIHFEGAESGLGPSELRENLKLEDHIRSVYDRWLNSVQPGDLGQIRYILENYHPGHAASPQYSKREFFELLYGEEAL